MIVLHGSYNAVTFWSWYPDPVVILGILAAAWLYARAVGPQWETFPRRRVVSFAAGLLAVVLALLSPIEPLADDYLLSAHMVQHLLLTLAAPPLLLYGMAPWMYAPFQRVGWFWRSWRFLSTPILAFVLFHVPFSLAHVPIFYDLTLESLPVHMLEHAVFTSTALLAWWPVLAPGRENGQLPHGLQMLYLFVQTLPGQLVGALITAADAPLYEVYALAPRVWNITPLVDQQAGGLIMWIGTGTLYLAGLGVVFFRWASQEDASERQRYARARAASSPPSPLP